MLNWLTRYAFVVAELNFDEQGALTESVLDVGCGPHGLSCAAPVARFVGTDVLFPQPVAPGMVAFRNEPGPLPFDDAAFDTVVCLDVLEHVPPGDRRGFVRELSRVASRRVLIACPSDESEWVQDVLKLEYRARGLALPIWLNEHDEHGLPTAAEIRDMCTSVEGFSGRELPMTNGLLATLAVMADMLPELAGEANAEYREHSAEWLETFGSARFGNSRRKGYVLERDVPTASKVLPANIQDSVWSALRCPACGIVGFIPSAGGGVCASCAHTVSHDMSRAIDLTISATGPRRVLAPLKSTSKTRLLLRPDWLELRTWLPVLASYVAHADPAGDHVLCLDAVDLRLGLGTIQEMVATACDSVSAGRDFAGVLLLDTPYERAGTTEIRSPQDLAERIGLKRRDRPQRPEELAEHVHAAKLLCDAIRAVADRRLYVGSPAPWISRDPLVTVRIATWNGHETLLNRAIPSVLAGTHQNFEVIVCSDGPDSAARAAINGLGDARVRYVELPERPVYPERPWSFWQTAGSHAANRALDEARGSFIAPLDHDDAFTVDHIEKMLAEARSSGADFVHAQARLESPDGNWAVIGRPGLPDGHATHGAAMYSSRLMHMRLDPDCWLLDEGGDFNMFRRVVETGARTAFLPEVVLEHFKERTSIGASDLSDTTELQWRAPQQLAADLARTKLDWLLEIPVTVKVGS
jgi:SAM-dependent methyltransferase